MNKRRIISISISIISIVIGLLIFIQISPYLNLRECKVYQEIGLDGFKIVVVNHGNSTAKFPKMQFKLYKGHIYVGNGTIDEFTIPPKSNVTKKINFDLHANLTQIPEILSENTTTIDGVIYVKILWGVNVPIKYKVVSNGSTSTLEILGRKIVVG